MILIDFSAWVEIAANGFRRYRPRRSSSRVSSETANSAGSSTAKIRRIWFLIYQPNLEKFPTNPFSSKHSGRQLELDDEQCEQLADAFFRIPDKYYAFEQMFLKLFVVG